MMGRRDFRVGSEAIERCKEEIERLNTQVAMLREALRHQYLSRHDNERDLSIECAIKETESDWLAKHDANVRGTALEEAAKMCETKEIPFDIDVWLRSDKRTMTINAALALANETRKMKGEK